MIKKIKEGEKMSQLSKVTSLSNEMVMFEALPYLKETIKEVIEKEFVLDCMLDSLGLSNEKEELKKDLSKMPDVVLTRREKEEIEDEIIKKMRVVLGESSKQSGKMYMASKMFPSNLIHGDNDEKSD